MLGVPWHLHFSEIKCSFFGDIHNVLPTNLKVEEYGEEKACWRKEVEALRNSCKSLTHLAEEER